METEGSQVVKSLSDKSSGKKKIIEIFRKSVLKNLISPFCEYFH